jgi:hypothetical protein
VIPITPDIVGPGIEEEYRDLIERIEKLEALLKPFGPSNETREGRMIYQLAWLRQEIEAERLPIPLDRKYWSTLGYLVGEGSLDYLGGEKAMGELTTILSGEGLLKPRHWPIIVAMLEDFLEFVQSHRASLPALDPIEERFLREAREIADDLVAGRITLPLKESNYLGWKGTYGTRHLDALPNFGNRQRGLQRALFDGIRPKVCRKGALPAPKPGLVWGGEG